MKSTVLAFAALISASTLILSAAHAAPVFKSADNETGWQQQAQHPGTHKSRKRVMNERAQWLANHTGPGTGCPSGEIYCGDNHMNMMNQEGLSDRPDRLVPAETYIGP